MTNGALHADPPAVPLASRPRVGFAGVGWIGRARLEALASSGTVDVAAVADPDRDARQAAAADLDGVARLAEFAALLEEDLDGIVIATPSALHAEQAVAALERGLAVFCQKPLGRTRDETQRVVDAAREHDRLLAVDFSYRHAHAAQAVREQVAGGSLGHVYAADLVFHNAYGPDKAWFYDRSRSGGGCLVDLGIHLVDLALWTLGFPEVEAADARLYAAGRPWAHGGVADDAQRDATDGAGGQAGGDAHDGANASVEDYVEARIDLAGGATARLTCSWRAPADRDAVIGATFYGTEAAARLRNVDGSFYDFIAERLQDRCAQTLAEPPDDWGGRAIRDWGRKLAAGDGWDPTAAEASVVADAIDRLYGRTR